MQNVSWESVMVENNITLCGKKHHPRRENTNIYALIAYCSFHLILCNSFPGHLSHYSSRNTYNADKQNTKPTTRKHTAQKTKKMSNIEQPALTEHYRI
jgi:hypothetical protein